MSPPGGYGSSGYSSRYTNPFYSQPQEGNPFAWMDASAAGFDQSQLRDIMLLLQQLAVRSAEAEAPSPMQVVGPRVEGQMVNVGQRLGDGYDPNDPSTWQNEQRFVQTSPESDQIQALQQMLAAQPGGARPGSRPGQQTGMQDMLKMLQQAQELEQGNRPTEGSLKLLRQSIEDLRSREPSADSPQYEQWKTSLDELQKQFDRGLQALHAPAGGDIMAQLIPLMTLSGQMRPPGGGTMTMGDGRSMQVGGGYPGAPANDGTGQDTPLNVPAGQEPSLPYDKPPPAPGSDLMEPIAQSTPVDERDNLTRLFMETGMQPPNMERITNPARRRLAISRIVESMSDEQVAMMKDKLLGSDVAIFPGDRRGMSKEELTELLLAIEEENTPRDFRADPMVGGWDR